jgi:hypothetical protein
MSKLAVEHQITLVAEVDLDGLSEGQRKVVENFTDHEKETFFTTLSTAVIAEVLPKVNANGSFAFLRIKE